MIKRKKQLSRESNLDRTICTEGRIHFTTLLRIMLGSKIVIFKALFP